MAAARIDVERLCPARRDDFLRFFDHEAGAAFADNPAWAKCYCLHYHLPPAFDWKALDAGAARTAMTARIDVAEMEGFLAYARGRVVGWLNAQPWHKLPHACAWLDVARPDLDVPAHEAAAVLCFVVDPRWRRRGVAKALLDAALASFAARGIRSVDAFPRAAGTGAKPADHFRGPASLFRAAGFTALRDGQDLTIVRKRLAPGP